MFTTFVPHSLLRGTSGVILFLALGATQMLALVAHSGRIGTDHVFRTGGVLNQVLILGLMPVFLAIVSWFAIKGIGSLLTQAFGQEYRQETVMHTYHAPSRRACDYRLKGSIMADTLPSYLCINEAAYRSFPDQDIAVVLIGRESFLGIHVDRALGDMALR